MKTRCALIATLIASLTPVEVDAHGLAAGFLSVETTDDHKGEVLLKLPEVEGNTPELQVIFGASCEELGPPTRIRRNDGVIKRWSVRCEQPLTGMRIELQGLNAVLGEVFVEFHSPTETEWNALVRRGQPLTILGAQAGHGADVRGDYFTLGVEHILSGFDHLLFVLALILIVYRALDRDHDHACCHFVLVLSYRNSALICSQIVTDRSQRFSFIVCRNYEDNAGTHERSVCCVVLCCDVCVCHSQVFC